jgi:hypothetical protein
MNPYALLMLLTLLLGGCAPAKDNYGPGMTVSFIGNIEGKSIGFVRATSSTGAKFTHPGDVGGRGNKKNVLSGGKVMGAAPDGRELPEWVEFEWQEWPYPFEKPTEKAAADAWSEEVHRLSRTLPHKITRVNVRSRVPQAVVDEIVEANRKQERGKLPEKKLWVYFIWYDDGIRFRWEMLSGCCKTVHSGGDVLPE